MSTSAKGSMSMWFMTKDTDDATLNDNTEYLTQNGMTHTQSVCLLCDVRQSP